MRFIACVSAAMLVLVLISGLPAAGQQPSFGSLNVCERVPIADVAAAVAGRALESRPVDSKGMAAARCVYGLEIAGARRAFVIWMNPPEDFDDFRKSAVNRLDVRDVGDEAFETADPDTKRVQLTARRRGKVTVQVTADRSSWAQAVAKVALAKF
jgi:hypothetical protein